VITMGDALQGCAVVGAARCASRRADNRRSHERPTLAHDRRSENDSNRQEATTSPSAGAGKHDARLMC